ncbi:MAG: beta-N-acetylhexosaminidase [Phreatobacter sp.]|uniref:beta-N-acetylhexosaminidase n=1 Tax=Phreatobacter sp. TaxID=1966341 RepID=UPI0040369D86
MAETALILGCAGTTLSAEEAAFFRDLDPWGLILFRRNCADPDQIRRLVGDFRDAVGRADAPVLVDQEGGRVQRLGPPHWPKYPPARVFARLANDPLHGRALARLAGRLMAHDLHAVGITVDCAPVLDVPVAGAHDVIGDRALSTEPGDVAALGRAVAEGLIAGGVLPVIKHIPGHGRAGADSHAALPVVDAGLEALQADFLPFRTLTDMPLAMTAHVVYTAIDPRRPATTSRRVMQSVVRGAIGYDGLVMTDDLSMNALEGTLGERARRSYRAGCDVVLHCNGKIDEMRQVAAEARPLGGRARQRAGAALGRIRHLPELFDAREAFALFEKSLERAQSASSTAFAADHALSL